MASSPDGFPAGSPASARLEQTRGHFDTDLAVGNLEEEPLIVALDLKRLSFARAF